MAIKIKFVNLIIPIEKNNNSTLEGGFNNIIKKYENSIGKSVWFDKHLFRIGGWTQEPPIDNFNDSNENIL